MQIRDGRWDSVIQCCPSTVSADKPNEVFAHVRWEDEHDRIQDPHAVAYAFELSVELGQLKHAAAFLENSHRRQLQAFGASGVAGWCFTEEDLMYFARAVDFAARACPAAIEIDDHQKWRELIKRCSGLLPTVSKDSALLLHQASLGICSTAVRSRPTRDVLAKKYYGTLSGEDLAKFLDRRMEYLRADRRPARPVTNCQPSRRRWQPCDVDVGESPWPHPWSCSTRPCASIAAISADGACHVESAKLIPHESDDDVRADARELIESIGPDARIAWDDDSMTRQLVGQIFAIAREVAPDSGWLVLAADPQIASLPWNLLAQKLADPSRNPLLVSVVPSLNWLTEASLRRSQHGRWRERPSPFLISDEALLVNGQDELGRQELTCLRGRLEKDSQRQMWQSTATAFVLGHGVADESEDYWTVVAPNKAVEINEWIQLGSFRLVVIHACLCGRVGNHFVGDLSGIPGILLTQDTHLCCSAMTEVSATTALRLQEHLVDGSLPSALDATPRHCEWTRRLGFTTCTVSGTNPDRIGIVKFNRRKCHDG